MAMTRGFKQTEVGTVPEDWDVVKLGSIAEFTSGCGIAVANLMPSSAHAAIPVYGGNGVAGFTTEALIKEPTVVIGRVGQKCGEVYLTDGPAWVTDNALYPRKLSNRVSASYLALALRDAGLNSFKNRNDLPLVTQTILSGVVFSLPPKAEQEAIAGALSDADALLSARERLIAKKRQLKHGAMHELLTGRRRLPGFTDPWQKKRLGELGQFLKGSGVTKAQALSGAIPCVRYGELYTRHSDSIKAFHSWISREVAFTATALKRGDVLFAGSGETKEEIGRCAAFVDSIEAYAGGDIVILRPSNADSLFLGYALNTPQVMRQKASYGQGDAVVHISAHALARVTVALPSPEEQAAIAAVLRDLDADIAAEEAQLTKARQLKQGMMRELLTGRVRLV